MFGKLNMYFFGEERICLNDFVWFYGTYTFIGVIAVMCLIINLLNA